MKLQLLCFFVIAALAAAKVDYSGHMVLRVVPETEKQLNFLHNLEVSTLTLDFWTSPSTIGRPVDIRVSPAEYYNFARSAAAVGLSHTIHILDVGKLIADEEKAIAIRKLTHNSRAFDFSNYHTYDEIATQLTEWANANLISVTSIGNTVEGRDIWMATIGANSGKPLIYMDCAMHAREWITPATCMYFIQELAQNHATDSVLNKYEWSITPVSNPDGYEFTWTNDRLWRKNRNRHTALCTGTDPNRNFGAGFGGPGTSNQPCSDTYHGPSAFSEAESAAMRDVLAARRGNVKAVLSIHSYSQYWMSPFGFNYTEPTEFPEMNRVMGIGVNALTAVHGTQYTYGTIGNVIYLAAGSTADHAYISEGVIYAYAVELRDTGLYGFQLPPAQIIPTAEETWAGVKAAVGAMQ